MGTVFQADLGGNSHEMQVKLYRAKLGRTMGRRSLAHTASQGLRKKRAEPNGGATRFVGAES